MLLIVLVLMVLGQVLIIDNRSVALNLHVQEGITCRSVYIVFGL